jgi:vitamin B12 transporter
MAVTVGVVASWAALGAMPVFAQAQAQAETLQTVLVTANRQMLPRDETAGPVRTLDRAALEALPFTDITEALATLPGVNIRRSGGPDGEPSLGMYGISAQPRSSSSTTLAVNGVALNNGLFPEASLNMLPLALVQRLEVVQGPSSSAYGNNARLGVVNLITRRSARFTGELAGSYARWNTGSLGGWVGGGLGAQGSYLVGLERRQTDGHLQPKGQADFSDSQLDNAAAFVDQTFGPLRLAAGYIRYGWERHNPSYLVQPGNPAAANPVGTPTSRFESGTRQHAHLVADWTIGPAWSAQLALTANDFDERTTFNTNYGTPSGFGATAPTDLSTRSTGALAKLEWNSGTNLLTVGLELQDGKLTDRVAGSVRRGHTTGFFVQDRYLALDGQLVITGGWRHDRFSFYDATSSSPRLGVVFKPQGAAWLLRAQSSRAFSAPSFNQLFGSFGNTKLVATTLRVDELGAEIEPARGLHLGATAFETRTTDPIFPRPRNQNPICAPGPGNCFVNVPGTLRTSGLTLDLRQVLGAWQWGGSYTYLDPRENTFATSRHVLKIDARWRVGPFGAGATLRHERDRYFQDGHRSPFPDFTVVDAALSWQPNPAFALNLVLENVGNARYATTQIVSTSTAYPALPIERPGRFATLRGSWRF